MERRQKASYFFAGIMAAFLIVHIAVPAMAVAGKTITVYPGVGLYLDDTKFIPKDANGNPVEVFYYNGTTYVPIRAVSEAFGYPVQWDGNTRSVYIGKHTGDKPAVWLCDMDYSSGNKKVKTLDLDKDNIGNNHYHCILQTDNFHVERTYYINNQYSRISGVLYQRYDARSNRIWGTTPSEFKIYGDGEILYSHEFSDGSTDIKPISFDVDISGIVEIKIYLYSGLDNIIALGDAGLWT